ncbi:vWA domain-containing protein [Paenibacillus sp. OAS669]|uniref:vWA domain-containing protein n=1 Tax=Paenibacillus sp. OAS669 TaxID=2663821 RepID=UPI00178A04C1|nr:VWA domain-containing protein [Paenibacillus sp. OAS669]MBE1441869.1 nitric oxide reductase activation protein [Paenibacillus sp. OAS669]
MRFLENEVDAFLRMQLLDLARALSGWEELQLELSYLSSYNDKDKLIAVSQFWSYYPEQTKLTGMKTDVYLRAIGSAWFTDANVIAGYIDWTRTAKLPQLAKQWLAMCEEARLMTLCRKHRPGTAAVFDLRTRILGKHYSAKRDMHRDRREEADALLCGFASALNNNDSKELYIPDGFRTEDRVFMEELLYAVSTMESTKQAAQSCRRLMDHPERDNALEGDSRAQYFSLQLHSGTDQPLSWEYIGELKRKKKLKSHTELPKDSREDKPEQGERLPNWHRETEKQDESLLRFDIEQGSKSGLISDHVREADSGDQALGIVQGSSQASSRNEPEPPKPQALDRLDTGFAGKGDSYGRLNRKAVPVYRDAESPDTKSRLQYDEVLREVTPMVNKLKKTIRMTMEQKRIAPRNELLTGRLGKKLVRAAWEPLPRLFYKKNSPSMEVDAVFCLLIDCSASMYDKMEQTHRGIALFHESLRSLRVPHEIIGFWEDADKVTDKESPNVFHIITDFARSLHDSSAGPKLLQLQAEQDNRDGYSIRIAVERLMKRSEKQKVLLVFSDGEPSASDYHEDGIIDTCEAVLQARRTGVEVVSVFLGSGAVKDTERETMRNIYGRFSVLVPDVSGITDQLGPLLRKLLMNQL